VGKWQVLEPARGVQASRRKQDSDLVTHQLDRALGEGLSESKRRIRHDIVGADAIVVGTGREEVVGPGAVVLHSMAPGATAAIHEIGPEGREACKLRTFNDPAHAAGGIPDRTPEGLGLK